MSSLLHESQLVHEAAVVWLEDPDTFDYVRQALDKAARRTGKPRYARDGRMVGYVDLGTDAEANPDSGLFQRRTFFLLPHDRPNDPEGLYKAGAPGEAVDPRTIQPQRVGEKTPRSQGDLRPEVACAALHPSPRMGMRHGRGSASEVRSFM